MPYCKAVGDANVSSEELLGDVSLVEDVPRNFVGTRKCISRYIYTEYRAWSIYLGAHAFL